MEDNLSLLVSFISKYRNQLYSVIELVDDKSLCNDDRKKLFFEGLKLNLDKFETAEKWGSYVVGRVFKNRKINYYEECMYWLLVNIYLVDMCTTKEDLYFLAVKDITEIRECIYDEVWKTL